MTDRIVLRSGEALVAGGPPGTAAEPEVVIGELDGPVGTALATLTGDQVKGHSRVFALLNTDIMVRPVPLHQRGVSRSSRTWRRDAMDAWLHQTNAACAYGEIARS